MERLTVTRVLLTKCLQSDHVYSASTMCMMPNVMLQALEETLRPVVPPNKCAGEKNASVMLTGISRNVVPGSGGDRK